MVQKSSSPLAITFSLWQYLLIVIALSWLPQIWFVLKAETLRDSQLVMPN